METAAARRYEVLAELGAGGMGRVFRARDVRLGREVALKRLLPSLACDPAAVERFLREARTAASFSHPNAVHVYDVDRDDEGPFIAMELVAGRSLADRLKAEGALPTREALRIVRATGSALAAAHAARILHRDVKPGNVLLDQAGTPRLTDFGLALFEGKGELTRSLVGTPEYMAPEQASDPSRVDARADVYALAATLYACLTGEAPRIVRESRIPEALRPALLKALSEKPDDRFPSMDAFLRALEVPSADRARRARVLFGLKIVGALGAAASVVSIAMALLAGSSQVKQPPTTRWRAPPARPERAPATPLPPTAGEVETPPEVVASFEQIQVHKTVIDAGYALGFVVNQGKAPLEHGHVEVKLLDEAGALVQAATGYLSAPRVEPGGKFPVAVLLKPFPKFARLEAKVENGSPGYTRPSLRLEALEKRLEKGNFGDWQFFAKIRNADAETASYPHVALVAFDKADKIVGVNEGYAAAKKLQPGEVSTVSTHVSIYGGEPPSRYELYFYAAPE